MKKLNYIAPINVLGYGTVGYNLLISLSKHFKMAAWPVGRQIAYPVPDTNKPSVQAALDNQADFDRFAPCLRIWHQFDMAEMIGKGPHIGFPIFELDKFNEREKHHLNSLDEIFVTSWWAADIVRKELPLRKKNNIWVIPLGVDRSIFYDTVMPSREGPTRFLNVGKWEIRKGHDVLIEAFEKAFTPQDDVELWMMNHNPFLSKEQELEWHRLYKNNPMGSKVKLLPRVNTQEELADVMRQVHCGVFPSRAEGWNLEALEMMSCGRHVITTDYAAHKDFCDHKNSWLLNVEELEPAWDGIWFNGEGNWAKINVDELADRMAQYHKLRREWGNNRFGVETAKRLTWDNSAAIIKQTIEGIENPQSKVELD
jgi:glycosyltransferase involved in cell wall biosynthesis